MNIEILLDWVDSNEIKRKTIEAFWEDFNRYRNEEPAEFQNLFGDYNEDCLEINYDSTALKIVDLSYGTAFDNQEKTIGNKGSIL